MRGRGHAWQGGCAWQGGVFDGGVHGGGHAWQGGMCGIQSMSGRYASYWNAFLFLLFSSE